MKTADILDRSLMKLEEQTGVKILQNLSPPSALITITFHSETDESQQKANLDTKDTHIKIKHDIGNFDFKVIILPNASKAEILNRFQNTKKDTIFISPYFTKNVADFLIEKKINFIDIAGNTYLFKKGLFFLIKGNKKPTDLEISRPKRTFQETGLKILFVLLSNPKIINFTYREIAELSKTSASSVQYIFEELEEMKFLIHLSKQKRKLVNKKKLLERWTIAYGENLKPKLHRGYFKFKNPTLKSKLRGSASSLTETYWGGEFAAEIMTNYLDAQFFTLYSSDRFSALVRELLIIPTEKSQSELELIDVFWKKDSKIIFSGKGFVSPILTYADLYNSLNERNLETAQKVLKNELQYLL
ncbi:MAG: type IV toxin-antitoxin system AbiEi family antitoxin [Chitinophagales bacterium]